MRQLVVAGCSTWPTLHSTSEIGTLRALPGSEDNPHRCTDDGALRLAAALELRLRPKYRAPSDAQLSTGARSRQELDLRLSLALQCTERKHPASQHCPQYRRRSNKANAPCHCV